jgi:hypothetical protein
MVAKLVQESVGNVHVFPSVSVVNTTSWVTLVVFHSQVDEVLHKYGP